jgi:class 3 adenylate cyclase
VAGADALGSLARAGLHTGECEVHPGSPAGAAIDGARRLARLAAGGEILVSTTVKDLVAGSGITFEPRAPGGGAIAEPGPLYAVAPVRLAGVGAATGPASRQIRSGPPTRKFQAR